MSQDPEDGKSDPRGVAGDPKTPTRRMWGYFWRAEREGARDFQQDTAKFSFKEGKEVEDTGEFAD